MLNHISQTLWITERFFLYIPDKLMAIFYLLWFRYKGKAILWKIYDCQDTSVHRGESFWDLYLLIQSCVVNDKEIILQIWDREQKIHCQKASPPVKAPEIKVFRGNARKAIHLLNEKLRYVKTRFKFFDTKS